MEQVEGGLMEQGEAGVNGAVREGLIEQGAGEGRVNGTG